jgi:hypothetical protein
MTAQALADWVRRARCPHGAAKVQFCKPCLEERFTAEFTELAALRQQLAETATALLNAFVPSTEREAAAKFPLSQISTLLRGDHVSLELMVALSAVQDLLNDGGTNVPRRA